MTKLFNTISFIFVMCVMCMSQIKIEEPLEVETVSVQCEQLVGISEIDLEIKTLERAHKTYNVPDTSGFKSYMPYTSITSTDSPQYILQNEQAYTGKYGIRQVNGRYCVALGSYFTTEIGTDLDLVLENGTVIPCILADQKDDAHTDSKNIVTMHNGCASEFIIDQDDLHSGAKQMGDISYCNDDWQSPVKQIIVY